MKHSQVIGVVAVLAMIGICFMPWSFIPGRDITITGMNEAVKNYGRPGVLHIYLGAACLLLFIIPKIWAKRINVFIAGMLMAWSIRNYILITSCYLGECPEKKAGIFLLVASAAVILLMSFLPKLPLPVQAKD